VQQTNCVFREHLWTNFFAVKKDLTEILQSLRWFTEENVMNYYYYDMCIQVFFGINGINAWIFIFHLDMHYCKSALLRFAVIQPNRTGLISLVNQLLIICVFVSLKTPSAIHWFYIFVSLNVLAHTTIKMRLIEYYKKLRVQ